MGKSVSNLLFKFCLLNLYLYMLCNIYFMVPMLILLQYTKNIAQYFSIYWTYILRNIPVSTELPTVVILRLDKRMNKSLAVCGPLKQVRFNNNWWKWVCAAAQHLASNCTFSHCDKMYSTGWCIEGTVCILSDHWEYKLTHHIQRRRAAE